MRELEILLMLLKQTWDSTTRRKFLNLTNHMQFKSQARNKLKLMTKILSIYREVQREKEEKRNRMLISAEMFEINDYIPNTCFERSIDRKYNYSFSF